LDADIAVRKEVYDAELNSWMAVRHILKHLGRKQLRARLLEESASAGRIISRFKWLSHSSNSIMYHQQQVTHRHESRLPFDLVFDIVAASKVTIAELVDVWRERTVQRLRLVEAQMHRAARRVQATLKAGSVRARMYVVNTTLDSLAPERNEMLRALESGIGKRRAKDIIIAWMQGVVARVKVDNIKTIVSHRHTRYLSLSDPPDQGAQREEPPLVLSSTSEALPSWQDPHVIHCTPRKLTGGRQLAAAAAKPGHHSSQSWDPASVISL